MISQNEHWEKLPFTKKPTQLLKNSKIRKAFSHKNGSNSANLLCTILQGRHNYLSLASLSFNILQNTVGYQVSNWPLGKTTSAPLTLNLRMVSSSQEFLIRSRSSSFDLFACVMPAVLGKWELCIPLTIWTFLISLGCILVTPKYMPGEAALWNKNRADQSITDWSSSSESSVY